MTREEAIKVLQREKDYVQQAIQKATDGDGYVSPDGLIRADDYVAACTEAISALREQDVADTDVGKMTNADRIRAMSDEELAAFLSEFKDCGGGCLVGKGIKDCSGLCATVNTLKIWLQQPAEEDDHA